MVEWRYTGIAIDQPLVRIPAAWLWRSPAGCSFFFYSTLVQILLSTNLNCVFLPACLVARLTACLLGD